VKVLAEESIKMREFPEIIFTNGPTGRRATFRHGPDMWEIIEPYVLGDKDWQVLRESYPDLDEAMLRTAVRYYETYPDEIGPNQSQSGFVSLKFLLDEDISHRVAEGLRFLARPQPALQLALHA
jgi:hypothetical protein